MYQKILVPLDGSELAEQILPTVIAIAADENAEILLLRVPDTMISDLLAPEALGTIREHAETEAVHYLARLSADLRAKGIKVQPYVIRTDSVYSTILNTAEELGADLIAMSTHGRSGLPRLVMGSVADDVVRYASLPVLLIRPQPARAGARVNRRSTNISMSPAQQD